MNLKDDLKSLTLIGEFALNSETSNIRDRLYQALVELGITLGDKENKGLTLEEISLQISKCCGIKKEFDKKLIQNAIDHLVSNKIINKKIEKNLPKYQLAERARVSRQKITYQIEKLRDKILKKYLIRLLQSIEILMKTKRD